MPLVMLLPTSLQRRAIPTGGSCTVGRCDLKCTNLPAAMYMFVSRQQCTLRQQGHKQVELVHTGAGNPTLVLRPNQQPQVLKQGDRAVLSPGDSFSLIATKPEAAIQLLWEESTQQQQQQQQQEQQQSLTPTVSSHEQQRQQQQQQERPVPAAEQTAAAVAASRQAAGARRSPVRRAKPTAAATQAASQPTAAAAATSGPEGKSKAVAAGRQSAAAAAAASEPAEAAKAAAKAEKAAKAAAAKAAAAVAAAAKAAAGVAAAAAAGHRPVMLLLVGVPGSGKSTFSAELASVSSRSWLRVNQDTIRGGKRGDRHACVAAAAAALAAGRNVVIDRCNVGAEQRAEFVALAAAAHAPCHCLVLGLQQQLCLARASARQGHEGGVEGKAAARVVSQMAGQLKKAGFPAASEGFEGVTVCSTPEQVAAALQHWETAAVGVGKEVTTNTSHAAAAAAAAAEEPPTKRARTDSSGSAGGNASNSHSCGSPAAADAAPKPQGDHNPPPGKVSAASPDPAAAAAGANAFAALMRGAKEQQQQQQAKQQSSPASKSTRPSAAAGAAGTGSWNTILSNIAADPERHRAVQSIWHVDDQVVGMLDKYPKACHHALLLARQQGLHRASQLGQQHLPLLHHMRQLALGWIQQQQQEVAGGQGQVQQQAAGQQSGQQQHGAQYQQQLELQQQQEEQQQQLVPIPAGWRLGFHSVPSMAQLHLHIISEDYDSPCLKTKRHWNSFTSAFFLHLDGVMQALQGPEGSVAVDEAAAEVLLKQALACHSCGQPLKNMPALKEHLRSCS